MPLFQRREPYEKQFNVHAPASTVERINKVKEAEGASLNSIWITLVNAGLDLHQWLQDHESEIHKLRSAYGMGDMETALRLMEAGLAIFKKDPKVWKSFAFSKELGLPTNQK